MPASERTNQVLEELAVGSLGEMGVNVFEMGLSVSTNIKPCEFITEPRRFDPVWTSEL